MPRPLEHRVVVISFLVFGGGVDECGGSEKESSARRCFGQFCRMSIAAGFMG